MRKPSTHRYARSARTSPHCFVDKSVCANKFRRNTQEVKANWMWRRNEHIITTNREYLEEFVTIYMEEGNQLGLFNFDINLELFVACGEII